MTTAQAAPTVPPQPNMVPPQDAPSVDAVTTQAEVDGIEAEQVQWRRRRHRRVYVPRRPRRRAYIVRPRRRRRVYYY